MKTLRRDALKRQIERGDMLCKCNFHLTDDYRFDADYNFGRHEGWLPCFVGEYKDHIEGRKMFYESDFRGKSGHCWQNDDGTVDFSIHSNASYTLRRAIAMRTILFFAPSLKAACDYLKAVCEKEEWSGSIPHSVPKEQQVPHVEGWYTFEAKVFRV